MNNNLEILIVEDDEGHSHLIEKAFRRVGLQFPIHFFKEGHGILNFLFLQGEGPHVQDNMAYLLILDLTLPAISGVEVLTRMKQNNELRKIPVIILTTTKDPQLIELCHNLGCSHYITKPTQFGDFEKFIESIGMFLAVVQVPKICSSEILK